VVAVDGVPVQSIDDLRRELLKPGAPPERRIEVLHGGEGKAVLVRPVNGTISVRADRVPVRLSLVEAIPRALRDVWILNAMTLGALWDILRGRVVRRSPAQSPSSSRPARR